MTGDLARVTISRGGLCNQGSDYMNDDMDLMSINLDKKSKKYAEMAQIGIIILIVGIIITLGMRGFGPRERADGFSDQGELKDWAVDIVFLGAIIFYIGVLLLSLGLLTIALFGNKIHIYMRVGLLIATGLILGPTLGASYYLVGLWM